MPGDAATSFALFTGAVLWRAGPHVHTRTPVLHDHPVALFKLLIRPLPVWSFGMLVRKAGLLVPPFGLIVLAREELPGDTRQDLGFGKPARHLSPESLN
ncbi:MAG: hypothetical protein JF606_07210 [Burkholderiales bacterium]|nr:hypothetical protein [Burkholderiales bacterium]